MTSLAEKLTEIVGKAFEETGIPKDLGLVRVSDRPDLAQFQCNGAMAGLLHPVQHHDLDEAAGMQARCRRIEADIGRHDLARIKLIQSSLVGDLVDEATLMKRAQEIGLEIRHRLVLSGLILFRVNVCEDAAALPSRSRESQGRSATWL